MYHFKKWDECEKCQLHRIRHKVVHFRGQLNADILWIGEAPGRGEDVIGLPFIAAAGDTLNLIIDLVDGEHSVTHCITNIVCCIPKDRNNEIRPPSAEEAAACLPRLAEIIKTVNPKLIVTLGDVADTYLPPQKIPTINLVHPSAINRGPTEEKVCRIHTAAAAVIQFLDDLQGMN